MKMPVLKSVQWTKPGSKNKYLEDPFMRHADELPDEMAKGINEALEEAAR
jgi:hypothetical protein